MGDIYSIIFIRILTIFTNLRCLKFNPSSSFRDVALFHIKSKTAISSTLLELHVSVEKMENCLDILDGRFDQLRVLYVVTEYIGESSFPLTNNNEVDYFD